MGQRFIMFDDLDGETAEDIETIEFAVAGVNFVVDLSGPHQQEFYTAQAELDERHRKETYETYMRYMRAGRRLGTDRVPNDMREALGDDLPPAIPAAANRSVPRAAQRAVPRSMRKNPKSDLAEVREFAAKFGITVGKGRIADDVWDAWENDDLSRLASGRLPSSSDGGHE